MSEDKLLYRILSGKIIIEMGQTYVVRPTSYLDKYKAEILFEDLLAEFKSDPDIFSKDDPAFIVSLYREGLPYDYKEQLKKIPEEIEELKVQLFGIVNEKGDGQEIRDKIKQKTESLMKILRILHCKDELTAEGMAELQRAKFLLRQSLNRKVDESILDKIAHWISCNFIKEEQYRKIARSMAFHNIVNAGRPFNNKPLTDEQVSLMYWYTFYKNVANHPDKPFEWTIEDDLALDGWCIIQSRKAKGSDAERYVESKISSDAVRNSKEIYIPREPGKDMSEVIEQANSPAAKAFKAARFNMINKGKLNESADIQLTKSL